MKYIKVLLRALAIKIVNLFAPAKASLKRNFYGIYFRAVKIVNFFAPAKASVARNFYGIYFRKKGTII